MRCDRRLDDLMNATMSELKSIATALLQNGAGAAEKRFGKLVEAKCTQPGITANIECVLLNGTGRAIEALAKESISELAAGNFSVDELWSMPALAARALLAPSPPAAHC